MKAYEAKFETNKGDIMTITVIAEDLAIAARVARDWEECAGSEYVLSSIGQVTQVVLIEKSESEERATNT